MEDKKKQTVKKAEKDAGNNQWTNNNLKYYPDRRPRLMGLAVTDD